jgi:hypothetical protein
MTSLCSPSPLVGQAYSRRSPPVVLPQESSRRSHPLDRMLFNLPPKGFRSLLNLTSSSKSRRRTSLLSLLLPSNLNKSSQRRLPPKEPQSKLPNRRNNNNKRSHKNQSHLNSSYNSNRPLDTSTDPLPKMVSRRLLVILSSLKVNSLKKKLRCT